MLLQAYDNEDADSARSALNSPFIKHMDLEYAKLARGLPLPQQEYAVPPAGIRANAAESYVSVNASKVTEQTTIEAEVNHVSWIIPLLHYFRISFFTYDIRILNHLALLFICFLSATYVTNR